MSRMVLIECCAQCPRCCGMMSFPDIYCCEWGHFKHLIDFDTSKIQGWEDDGFQISSKVDITKDIDPRCPLKEVSDSI